MPKEEFGRDFLLTIGSVYAVRSFGFDFGQGKLTSVFKADLLWEPGVNHARCYVEKYGTGWMPYFAKPCYYELWGMPAFGWEFHKWNLEKKPKPHQYDAPREECTCGFYSYSTEKRLGVGALKGIVEIAGRTLIGDRGYRSEKAEIVALLDPTKVLSGERGEKCLALIKKNYPAIPVFESVEAMFAAYPLTDPKDA